VGFLGGFFLLPTLAEGGAGEVRGRGGLLQSDHRESQGQELGIPSHGGEYQVCLWIRYFLLFNASSVLSFSKLEKKPVPQLLSWVEGHPKVAL
jgi:hypothetical protein